MIYRNGEIYYNAQRHMEIVERIPVTSGGLPIDNAEVLYMTGWTHPFPEFNTNAFVSVMVKRLRSEPLNLNSIFEEAWRQVEAGVAAHRAAILKSRQQVPATQQATGEEGV